MTVFFCERNHVKNKANNFIEFCQRNKVLNWKFDWKWGSATEKTHHIYSHCLLQFSTVSGYRLVATLSNFIETCVWYVPTSVCLRWAKTPYHEACTYHPWRTCSPMHIFCRYIPFFYLFFSKKNLMITLIIRCSLNFTSLNWRRQHILVRPRIFSHKY